MKNWNQFLRLAAILALAGPGLAITHAATQREEAAYPLNPGGRVRVENINGHVEVRAWEGEGVKLEVVKEGRTAEIVAGIRLHVDSTPERLTLKTELARVKRGWWGGRSREGRVNYLLQVPAGATLERVATVNGSLTITGVHGAVEAATVNGDVRGRALAGAGAFETVNGNISTAHARVADAARLQAKTVNGRIDLALPPGVSAAVVATTVNGTIESDFAITAKTRESRRRLAGRIGDGAARIDLGTVNGGIRLRELRNEQAAAH